jgi:hypothetical protein
MLNGLVLVLSGISQSKNTILYYLPAQVYFSPQGDCTKAIVGEVNKAKKEILLPQV